MDRLWVRLTLGFLAVTLATLALAAVAVSFSVQNSFRRYVGVTDSVMLSGPWEEQLLAHYAAQETWVGAESLLPGSGRGQGEGRDRGAQSFVAGADGVIRAATSPEWVGQPMATISATRQVPLRLNGEIVGWLGQQTPGLGMLDAAQQSFSEQVRRGLLLTGLLSAGVAVALGGLLAYSLARPLRDLARHMGSLTAEQVGEPVPMQGPLEVRDLAAAFNDLSGRLAAAEAQRQRMASDVAHELRTPVTVLRGHLEAMMDGVYPLDAEHLAVAYDQTLHLARLVADLQLLTRAEAGRLTLDLQLADLATIAMTGADRFGPLAQDVGLTIRCQSEAELPPVAVDVGRLQQVLDNLLVNALRHSGPGGEMVVSTFRAADGVAISVANSGELPADELAHVFDRFWRADEARARDAGGSGLGLAISRELVRLHGGTLGAESADGMTRFTVVLPA